MRPNIGDQFKVEGASNWKNTKDINGEIVYGSEVNLVLGSSCDEIKFGTLVFDCTRKWYVIKADSTRIYYCENGFGGVWFAVTSRFLIDNISNFRI